MDRDPLPPRSSSRSTSSPNRPSNILGQPRPSRELTASTPENRSQQRQSAIFSPRSPSSYNRTLSGSTSQSRRGIQLPPWQPDSEVSQCPVCGSAFGFLFRKHHCRKCGKVICDNCSRHRIGLPRQYIVHPLSASSSSPFASPFAALGSVSASLQVNSTLTDTSKSNFLADAQVVRVCNPCVPDPNLSPPPQTPTTRSNSPPRYLRRPTSLSQPQSVSLSPDPNRLNLRPQNVDLTFRARRSIPDRRGSESRGLENPPGRQSPARPHIGHIASLEPATLQRTSNPRRATLSSDRALHLAPSTPPGQRLPHRHLSSSHQPSGSLGSGPQRHAQLTTRQSSHRPPRREISEEDECPVCGNELPPFGGNGDTQKREEHVEQCIQLHSFSTSVPSASSSPIAAPPQTSFSQEARTEQFPEPPSENPDSLPGLAASSSSIPTTFHPRPRGNRMIVYRASEKDCTGEDGEPQECVICFEEFEPGHEMGRLECWCKFHRTCIRQWWETKGPGSCPTHQLHL